MPSISYSLSLEFVSTFLSVSYSLFVLNSAIGFSSAVLSTEGLNVSFAAFCHVMRDHMNECAVSVRVEDSVLWRKCAHSTF